MSHLKLKLFEWECINGTYFSEVRSSGRPCYCTLKHLNAGLNFESSDYVHPSSWDRLEPLGNPENPENPGWVTSPSQGHTGRKLEYLERTHHTWGKHANSTQRLQLAFKPITLFPWGDSANHHSTGQPVTMSILYIHLTSAVLVCQQANYAKCHS